MTRETMSPKMAALEDLRRKILLLAVDPGTPLDEAELCRTYGLSRTPMREIVQQLAGDGFLCHRPHRGAWVADMSHKTLRDFFLAAPMIYSAVLRLAADNATLAQIRDLKRSQAVFRKALASGDVAERTLANDSFHRITGEMADNLYLLPSFHRLLIDHARIGMTFFRGSAQRGSGAPDLAAEQHDEMISAIEARDGDRAADLAHAHWALSRSQIESFVMPASLDARLGVAPKSAAL